MTDMAGVVHEQGPDTPQRSLARLAGCRHPRHDTTSDMRVPGLPRLTLAGS